MVSSSEKNGFQVVIFENELFVTLNKKDSIKKRIILEGFKVFFVNGKISYFGTGSKKTKYQLFFANYSKEGESALTKKRTFRNPSLVPQRKHETI